MRKKREKERKREREREVKVERGCDRWRKDDRRREGDFAKGGPSKCLVSYHPIVSLTNVARSSDPSAIHDDAVCPGDGRASTTTDREQPGCLSQREQPTRTIAAAASDMRSSATHNHWVASRPEATDYA